MIEESLNIDINDISETAFLTLQCHALDALSKHSILNDKSAVETLELLKTVFKDSGSILHRRLSENRVRSSLVIHTVLRARKYDQYIHEFVDTYPDATIVNIGCGLDNRFERVDNGSLRFMDLDLPDIMNIKKEIFPEKDRYRQLSQSVFDYSWLDLLPAGQVMLVAEGVFMYCSPVDVKTLFLRLQEKLAGCEMVCEMFNSKWLRGWRRKSMEFKLRKQLKLGEGTTFQFGISDSDELERWSPGIRLLDDWSYLDSEELDATVLRLFRKNEAFRKLQWTVHYRIDKA